MTHRGSKTYITFVIYVHYYGNLQTKRTSKNKVKIKIRFPWSNIFRIKISTLNQRLNAIVKAETIYTWTSNRTRPMRNTSSFIIAAVLNSVYDRGNHSQPWRGRDIRVTFPLRFRAFCIYKGKSSSQTPPHLVFQAQRTLNTWFDKVRLVFATRGPRKTLNTRCPARYWQRIIFPVDHRVRNCSSQSRLGLCGGHR